MKQQPQNQASGASETTRFFCTRISSAAGAAGELCTTRKKEPDMGKRNTNSWEGQRPRCPQPQPETAQNTKIKLSTKTAQYRNQIFTLQRVFPLKFTFLPEFFSLLNRFNCLCQFAAMNLYRLRISRERNQRRID